MKVNKELKALISLVDEPDELLFNQVRDRIFAYGFDAIPALEKAWESTLDDHIQQRLIQIIHEIQQQQLYSELSNWAKFGYQDLLKGFLIVSRYQYPDLDINAITHEVGRIVQEVWMELNPNLTPLEKIKVVNHVIFDINKFGGNTANIKSPENFYLKPLLDSKKGNPLSLGMLYILIARSLKIPVYGVDLPRHFVLAYAEESPGAGGRNATEEHVIFYLNPFNKGAVFTRNEIDLYIRQLKVEHKDSYFLPCSNLVILRRMINGLIETYKMSSNSDKVTELGKLLEALGHGEE
jgi:regulator of sirC expression with transglutaminase-like and TPR domain